MYSLYKMGRQQASSNDPDMENSNNDVTQMEGGDSPKRQRKQSGMRTPKTKSGLSNFEDCPLDPEITPLAVLADELLTSEKRSKRNGSANSNGTNGSNGSSDPLMEGGTCGDMCEMEGGASPTRGRGSVRKHSYSADGSYDETDITSPQYWTNDNKTKFWFGKAYLGRKFHNCASMILIISISFGLFFGTLRLCQHMGAYYYYRMGGAKHFDGVEMINNDGTAVHDDELIEKKVFRPEEDELTKKMLSVESIMKKLEDSLLSETAKKEKEIAEKKNIEDAFLAMKKHEDDRIAGERAKAALAAKKAQEVAETKAKWDKADAVKKAAAAAAAKAAADKVAAEQKAKQDLIEAERKAREKVAKEAELKLAAKHAYKYNPGPNANPQQKANAVRINKAAVDEALKAVMEGVTGAAITKRAHKAANLMKEQIFAEDQITKFHQRAIMEEQTEQGMPKNFVTTTPAPHLKNQPTQSPDTVKAVLAAQLGKSTPTPPKPAVRGAVKQAARTPSRFGAKAPTTTQSPKVAAAAVVAKKPVVVASAEVKKPAVVAKPTVAKPAVVAKKPAVVVAKKPAVVVAKKPAVVAKAATPVTPAPKIVLRKAAAPVTPAPAAKTTVTQTATVAPVAKTPLKKVAALPVTPAPVAVKKTIPAAAAVTPAPVVTMKKPAAPVTPAPVVIKVAPKVVAKPAVVPAKVAAAPAKIVAKPAAAAKPAVVTKRAAVPAKAAPVAAKPAVVTKPVAKPAVAPAKPAVVTKPAVAAKPAAAAKKPAAVPVKTVVKPAAVPVKPAVKAAVPAKTVPKPAAVPTKPAAKVAEAPKMRR